MNALELAVEGGWKPLGQVVVITGATYDEGQRLALEVAGAGGRVVLASHDDGALMALAAACEFRGGAAACVVTKGNPSRETERITAEAMAEFGRIDVWVDVQPTMQADDWVAWAAELPRPSVVRAVRGSRLPLRARAR